MDRWQQVSRLYHDARARGEGERAAFLREACAGDEALRREVESLLAQDRSAEDFLVKPAMEVAGKGLGTGESGLDLIGRQLGGYQILSRLGAGGMGEVYRARDLKLGRDVAIKVLPSSFAADAERLRRFEREARLLAALNHPHVATIHGLEDFDGAPALVMELVEGPTLADRLMKGPLPIKEALQIAQQIAEALEAAHEKGVIHRDLKPANIKLTRAGDAKVLDFGLAKAAAWDASGPDLSQLPTITVDGTGEGIIAGTPTYMSPEQARGKPVDKRTDIWAFGCVLYEMLTGRAAFGRDTISDTIAAILERDPDWSTVPGTTPASVRRLLRRCLDKDPNHRFRDIGDARLELDDAAPPLIPETPTLAPRWRVWPRVAAAAAAVALVGGAFVARRLVAPAPPVVAEVRVHRLTDARGLEEFPAVSPDGKSVAFVAYAGGNAQIFVRLVAGGTPLQITRDAADHLYPRWSPDSASILYYQPPADGESAGAIWEIPALGGGPRRIVSSVGGADISHDGKRLVFPRFANGHMELAVSARDASDVKTLAELESGYYYMTPRWSFDDRLVAYQRGTFSTFDIFVVSIDGGQSRQITQHGARLEGLTWAPERASIIFSSSRGETIWYLPTTNLWRVEADGTGLQQLTFGEASYAYPDANAIGTLVVNRVRRQFDIWRFPVDGSPVDNVRRGVRITQQTSQVHTPSVAPGDRELVYVSSSGGHANLWVMNLETRQSRQITYETDPELRVGLPLWSPDGKQIAYFTVLGSSWNYFLIRPDGSDSRLLAGGAGNATWSQDGRWLYYSDYPIGTHLRKVSATGGSPVVVRSDHASRVALAPDGGALYYTIDLPLVSGGSDLEIRVARPEDAPSRVLTRIPARRMAPWQVFQPVISPDGQWLALALLDGVTSNLWALSTSTGRLRQLTDFGDQPTFITRRASWSSDGRFIFAAVGEGDSDVVLLEGLKP